MQKLMLKYCKLLTLIVGLLFFQKSNAQTPSELVQLGSLLTDILYYSEQYVVPASDVAMFQSSSGWINSPKTKDKWKVTLGMSSNVLYIPKGIREFRLNNSDLSFFQIEGANSVIAPTSVGNDNQFYLVGQLGTNEVRLETPDGINQEFIAYPYVQGGIELPLGFEFLARFSKVNKSGTGKFQLWGLGIKHNLSQYFPAIEQNKFYFSIATNYSKQDISSDFLNVQTAYGDLGINIFNAYIDSFHFQLSASKEIKKFELITNLILNKSSFEYIVEGNRSEIENVFPVKNVVNELLTQIANDKTRIIGEVSGRYQISKFYIQSSIAFGNFVNGNIGIQYQF